jgi:outer membrane protein assembly factor BamB
MIGAISRSQCFMPHPRYEETELAGPNIHSGPIYWNGKVYSMPEKDFIRAFHYNVSSGILATTPAVRSTVRAPDGMPGAAIIASSNGTSDGVIWATIPKADRQWQNVPRMLLAFDATTLNELWRDDDDDIAFAKFTPPTVVDGKVFPPDVRKQNDRLRTEVRADAGLVLRHSASLRKLYRPERRARRRNRRRNAVA